MPINVADQEYRFSDQKPGEGTTAKSIMGYTATPSLYYANGDGNLQFRRVTDFEGAQAIMMRFTEENFDDFWYFDTNQDVRDNETTQYASDGHFMTWGFRESERDANNPTFDAPHCSRTLSEGMYNYFAAWPARAAGVSAERQAYELTLTPAQKTEYDSWVNVERYYAYKTQWPKVYGAPLRENDGGNGQILAELLTNGDRVNIGDAQTGVDLTVFDFSLFPVPVAGSQFKKCQFNNNPTVNRLLTEGTEINFDGSSFDGCVLSDYTKVQVINSEINLRNCSFEGATLANVDMSMLPSSNTPKMFKSCVFNTPDQSNDIACKLPKNLRYADLSHSKIHGCVITSEHDISYADFSDAELEDASKFYQLQMVALPTNMVGAKFHNVKGTMNVVSTEEKWNLKKLFVNSDANNRNYYVSAVTNNEDIDLSRKEVVSNVCVGNAIFSSYENEFVAEENPVGDNNIEYPDYPETPNVDNVAELLNVDTSLLSDNAIAQMKVSKIILGDIKAGGYFNFGGLSVTNSSTDNMRVDVLQKILGHLQYTESDLKYSADGAAYKSRTATVVCEPWTIKDNEIRTSTSKPGDDAFYTQESDLSVLVNAAIHDRNTWDALQQRMQYVVEGSKTRDSLNGRMLNIKSHIDEFSNHGENVTMNKYISIVPEFFGIASEDIVVNDRLHLSLFDENDAPMNIPSLILKVDEKNTNPDQAGALLVKYDDFGHKKETFDAFKVALNERRGPESWESKNKVLIKVYKATSMLSYLDSIDVTIPKSLSCDNAVIRMTRDSAASVAHRNAVVASEKALIQTEQFDHWNTELDETEDARSIILESSYFALRGDATSTINDANEEARSVMLDVADKYGVTVDANAAAAATAVEFELGVSADVAEDIVAEEKAIKLDLMRNDMWFKVYSNSDDIVPDVQGRSLRFNERCHVPARFGNMKDELVAILQPFADAGAAGENGGGDGGENDQAEGGPPPGEGPGAGAAPPGGVPLSADEAAALLAALNAADTSLSVVENTAEELDDVLLLKMFAMLLAGSFIDEDGEIRGLLTHEVDFLVRNISDVITRSNDATRNKSILQILHAVLRPLIPLQENLIEAQNNLENNNGTQEDVNNAQVALDQVAADVKPLFTQGLLGCADIFRVTNSSANAAGVEIPFIMSDDYGANIPFKLAYPGGSNEKEVPRDGVNGVYSDRVDNMNQTRFVINDLPGGESDTGALSFTAGTGDQAGDRTSGKKIPYQLVWTDTQLTAVMVGDEEDHTRSMMPSSRPSAPQPPASALVPHRPNREQVDLPDEEHIERYRPNRNARTRVIDDANWEAQLNEAVTSPATIAGQAVDALLSSDEAKSVVTNLTTALDALIFEFDSVALVYIHERDLATEVREAAEESIVQYATTVSAVESTFVPLLNATVTVIYTDHVDFNGERVGNKLPYVDHKSFTNDNLVGVEVQLTKRNDENFEANVDEYNVDLQDTLTNSPPTASEVTADFETNDVSVLVESGFQSPKLPVNSAFIRVDGKHGYSHLLVRSNMDLTVINQYFTTTDIPGLITNTWKHWIDRTDQAGGLLTGNNFDDAIVNPANANHRIHTLPHRCLNNCIFSAGADQVSVIMDNLESLTNCVSGTTAGASLTAAKLTHMSSCDLNDFVVVMTGDRKWLSGGFNGANAPTASEGWCAKYISGCPKNASGNITNLNNLYSLKMGSNGAGSFNLGPGMIIDLSTTLTSDYSIGFDGTDVNYEDTLIKGNSSFKVQIANIDQNQSTHSLILRDATFEHVRFNNGWATPANTDTTCVLEGTTFKNCQFIGETDMSHITVDITKSGATFDSCDFSAATHGNNVTGAKLFRSCYTGTNGNKKFDIMMRILGNKILNQEWSVIENESIGDDTTIGALLYMLNTFLPACPEAWGYTAHEQQFLAPISAEETGVSLENLYNILGLSNMSLSSVLNPGGNTPWIPLKWSEITTLATVADEELAAAEDPALVAQVAGYFLLSREGSRLEDGDVDDILDGVGVHFDNLNVDIPILKGERIQSPFEDYIDILVDEEEQILVAKFIAVSQAATAAGVASANAELVEAYATMQEARREARNSPEAHEFKNLILYMMSRGLRTTESALVGDNDKSSKFTGCNLTSSNWASLENISLEQNCNLSNSSVDGSCSLANIRGCDLNSMEVHPSVMSYTGIYECKLDNFKVINDVISGKNKLHPHGYQFITLRDNYISTNSTNATTIKNTLPEFEANVADNAAVMISYPTVITDSTNAPNLPADVRKIVVLPNNAQITMNLSDLHLNGLDLSNGSTLINWAQKLTLGMSLCKNLHIEDCVLTGDVQFTLEVYDTEMEGVILGELDNTLGLGVAVENPQTVNLDNIELAQMGFVTQVGFLEDFKISNSRCATHNGAKFNLALSTNNAIPAGSSAMPAFNNPVTEVEQASIDEIMINSTNSVDMTFKELLENADYRHRFDSYDMQRGCDFTAAAAQVFTVYGHQTEAILRSAITSGQNDIALVTKGAELTEVERRNLSRSMRDLIDTIKQNNVASAIRQYNITVAAADNSGEVDAAAVVLADVLGRTAWSAKDQLFNFQPKAGDNVVELGFIVLDSSSNKYEKTSYQLREIDGNGLDTWNRTMYNGQTGVPPMTLEGAALNSLDLSHVDLDSSVVMPTALNPGKYYADENIKSLNNVFITSTTNVSIMAGVVSNDNAVSFTETIAGVGNIELIKTGNQLPRVLVGPAFEYGHIKNVTNSGKRMEFVNTDFSNLDLTNTSFTDKTTYVDNYEMVTTNSYAPGTYTVGTRMMMYGDNYTIEDYVDSVITSVGASIATGLGDDGVVVDLAAATAAAIVADSTALNLTTDADAHAIGASYINTLKALEGITDATDDELVKVINKKVQDQLKIVGSSANAVAGYSKPVNDTLRSLRSSNFVLFNFRDATLDSTIYSGKSGSHNLNLIFDEATVTDSSALNLSNITHTDGSNLEGVYVRGLNVNCTTDDIDEVDSISYPVHSLGKTYVLTPNGSGNSDLWSVETRRN